MGYLQKGGFKNITILLAIPTCPIKIILNQSIVLINCLLVRKYHAVHLVAGHDFRFGHKNEGDVEKLRSYCAAHGLGCDIIPRVEKDGVTVSSTYIRSLLEAGEVRRAAEFLGHYFSVEGTVRHGEGIGKTPESSVHAWTFAMMISKIDGTTKTPLTGAKFVLSRRADLKVSDMQCDENGNPTVKTDLLPMYTGDSARTPYELATAEKVAADTNITTRKARTKTAQRAP